MRPPCLRARSTAAAPDALSFGSLGNATFGGLQGPATSSLVLTNSGGGAVALSVGNNGGTTTFGGVLSDSGAGGSLTEIGAGMLTLTGTNTFSGNTTVASGTLTIGSNLASRTAPSIPRARAS